MIDPQATYVPERGAESAASPVSQTVATPAPILQFNAVSLYYRGTPAVRDVTLPVRRGQVTALLGPSGSGKSSLLTCANRLTDLVPGCVVTGSVTVAGTEVFAPATDPVALRRRVGMIFQRPNPFPMSIRRNLMLPLTENRIGDRAGREGRMVAALEAVGLWTEVKDRLDRPATALSGGQQQRLCIARALALEPEVLLMDEPCSALDPIASACIEDLIHTLKGRYTILIVTHNLGQARRVADHAALLWAAGGPGRLVEYGCVEQLFEAPQHPLTATYVDQERLSARCPTGSGAQPPSPALEPD